MTRRDRTVEISLGVWFQNATPWTETFRTAIGLRADTFRFKVSSDVGANAGSANDSILSLKLNLIFGPFDTAGLYVSLGSDFQSNDAQGTVIITDPKTGDPVDQVTPLVRSKGLKFGVRTSFVPALQTSLSLYRLGFASDLWFGGRCGHARGRAPQSPNRFRVDQLPQAQRLADHRCGHRLSDRIEVVSGRAEHGVLRAAAQVPARRRPSAAASSNSSVRSVACPRGAQRS